MSSTYTHTHPTLPCQVFPDFCEVRSSLKITLYLHLTLPLSPLAGGKQSSSSPFLILKGHGHISSVLKYVLNTKLIFYQKLKTKKRKPAFDSFILSSPQPASQAEVGQDVDCWENNLKVTIVRLIMDLKSRFSGPAPGGREEGQKVCPPKKL